MEFDDELKGFRNICRLFPLPNVVLFPHAVLPLHIFEPRYRQMTEDALGSDRLVTIVQIRPDAVWTKNAEPEIEPIACLGQILEYERLPDGRFNFLLVGKKRVRILEELSKTKLYRQARVEVLDDIYPGVPVDPLRQELIQLLREVSQRAQAVDPEIARLLDSDIRLGPLTDIIGHSLGLPSVVKQNLLAEARVDRRAMGLIGILQQVVQAAQGRPRAGPDRPFPPPFSVN